MSAQSLKPPLKGTDRLVFSQQLPPLITTREGKELNFKMFSRNCGCSWLLSGLETWDSFLEEKWACWVSILSTEVRVPITTPPQPPHHSRARDPKKDSLGSYAADSARSNKRSHRDQAVEERQLSNSHRPFPGSGPMKPPRVKSPALGEICWPQYTLLGRGGDIGSRTVTIITVAALMLELWKKPGK